MSEYEQRESTGKAQINLVVVGMSCTAHLHVYMYMYLKKCAGFLFL